MDDLQHARTYTFTSDSEYSGDRYTKTDSRYYEDLSLEMVMASTVVKDAPGNNGFR